RSVLDDPAYRGAENIAERHRALRAAAINAVDFPEAASRTLATHWSERTADERVYFVQLFTDLIDHAFLTRLSHEGERIALDDESATGPETIVRGRAIGRSGSATPVIFSMREASDGVWRIVDVSLGSMSLVGMYRAQFSRIL